MMLESRRLRRVAMVGLCSAPALGFAAGAAQAQKMTNEGMQPTGPMSLYEDQYQPRDQFTLYSEGDVELVRFKHTHLLSICDPHENHDQIGATAHGYPIKITWEGDSAVVEPGSCFAFEAASVKVHPATHLPQNDEITGTIRVIK